MMRKLTTALFVSVFVLALAGSAGALSIDPNPVNHQRDGGMTLDADVTLISLIDDTMTLQLSVSTGAITEIDVSQLFDSLSMPTLFNFVSDAGTTAGTGDVGVTAIAAVTEAQFIFSETVDAGETSDVFWIQFEDPIQLSWEGAVTFDTGIAQGETFTVIPEPSTSFLIGIGVLGICLAGRGRS